MLLGNDGKPCRILLKDGLSRNIADTSSSAHRLSDHEISGKTDCNYNPCSSLLIRVLQIVGIG